MFLQKCPLFRLCTLRKYLLQNVAVTNFSLKVQNYSGLPSNFVNSTAHTLEVSSLNTATLLHRKWYCKGLSDEEIEDTKTQKELKNITDLFPEARVALHILSTRTPDKIFDIHYKQHMPGKKAVRNHEWTCTYKFTWPETMKFESTSISKRQAAEKAATQALHWLYTNNRINKHGQPIYDKSVIEEIKSNFNESIKAEMSVKAVERIENIWKDYESGIKQMYENALEKANLKAIEAPAQLTKDSSIDEEDEYSDQADLVEEIEYSPDTKDPVHPVYGRVLKQPSQQALKRRQEALNRIFDEYEQNITPLPIDQYADQITSTLENNQVVVIVGAAGCGKSTRVPAAILRHCGVNATLVVSEPRRVAAIGLAERVASELSEEVGQTVGYQVRLHSKPPRPPAGSVLYCTSGVLLNRLHSNPCLEGCSHVIIDEAHLRDVNTDVTLLLLKRAMRVNPGLKLIVMSATLDTKVFTEYFELCPVIEVPGRTYPVDVSYLEDIQKKYNLHLPCTLANCLREDGRPQLNVTEVSVLNVTEIVEVIKAIDKHEKEGAILVFLPGWAEIKQAKQLLCTHYANSTLHLILPVHSRLSTTEQSQMFSTPPPGVRKIVISTNVSETSVTVPDVLHVIDSGAHRENTVILGSGIASLDTAWVSLASAKQRCGRAGRVQPGHCYRLYTKEKEAQFVEHTTPEILRVPLDQTVLDCKTYAPEDKAQDFLSQLPEPPSSNAVQLAVNDLIDLGALTPSEQLTRLGSIISSLPLSPRAAVTLTIASVACSVLPHANIAALHTCADLFLTAADRRDEIREIKRKFYPTSDHVALHRIQHEFENELHNTDWTTVDSWCNKYTLKKERLGYVKSLSSLYLRELLKTGVIERNLELEDINRFSDIDELSVATLYTGVGALLVTKRHVRTKGKMKAANEVFATTGDRAHIASESVNYNITKRTTSPILLTYYGCHHSNERRALMVYKSSVISPHAVVMFHAGTVEQIENDGETAIITIPKHKLKINVPASQASPLLKAREMLQATFKYYINRDVRDLEYDDIIAAGRFRIRLLKAVCRVLVEASGNGEIKIQAEDIGSIKHIDS